MTEPSTGTVDALVVLEAREITKTVPGVGRAIPPVAVDQPFERSR